RSDEPCRILLGGLLEVGGERFHEPAERFLLREPLGVDLVLDGLGHPLADVVLVELDLEPHGSELNIFPPPPRPVRTGVEASRAHLREFTFGWWWCRFSPKRVPKQGRGGGPADPPAKEGDDMRSRTRRSRATSRPVVVSLVSMPFKDLLFT